MTRRLRSPLRLRELPPTATVILLLVLLWPFVTLDQAPVMLLWETGWWAFAIVLLFLLARPGRRHRERREQG